MALEAFRGLHGPSWRYRLARAWALGLDTGGDHALMLRVIRNRRGSHWIWLVTNEEIEEALGRGKAADHASNSQAVSRKEDHEDAQAAPEPPNCDPPF